MSLAKAWLRSSHLPQWGKPREPSLGSSLSSRGWAMSFRCPSKGSTAISWTRGGASSTVPVLSTAPPWVKLCAAWSTDPAPKVCRLAKAVPAKPVHGLLSKTVATQMMPGLICIEQGNSPAGWLLYGHLYLIVFQVPSAQHPVIVLSVYTSRIYEIKPDCVVLVQGLDSRPKEPRTIHQVAVRLHTAEQWCLQLMWLLPGTVHCSKLDILQDSSHMTRQQSLVTLIVHA